MRKELQTSDSTFKTIIEGNGMYVDKTKFLYDFIGQLNGQFFLSRPRRFGKSMFLSSLKSIFSGDKELFKGTYIYDKEYDWAKYPIIHLSMNKLDTESIQTIKESLLEEIDTIAEFYSIEKSFMFILKNNFIKKKTIYEISNPSIKFNQLINKLHEKYGKVVILIDEYDKPLLDNITNKVECEKIRLLLQGFYGQIKANIECLRFTLLTGVSKFTQMSVFSALNNLTDLTMDAKYADLCGFTQEECEEYFAEWIVENAKTLEMSKSAYLAKLKEYYNGCRFTEKNQTLYNPVSWTNAMKNCDFENYWSQTGTPQFLFQLFKNNDYGIENIESFDEIETTKMGFDAYDVTALEITPLLYQTGYLTIKDFDGEDTYTLTYPNKEVRESFLEKLQAAYSKKDLAIISTLFKKLYSFLANNQTEELIKGIKTYYANVNYELIEEVEKSYQLVFYLLFRNLSFEVDTEIRTNDGRLDATIKTEKYIYIFEFKFNKTAQIAMDQIHEKKYYQKYELDGKDISLIGINFNGDKKQIDDYIIEKI